MYTRWGWPSHEIWSKIVWHAQTSILQLGQPVTPAQSPRHHHTMATLTSWVYLAELCAAGGDKDTSSIFIFVSGISCIFLCLEIQHIRTPQLGEHISSMSNHGNGCFHLIMRDVTILPLFTCYFLTCVYKESPSHPAVRTDQCRRELLVSTFYPFGANEM